MITVSMDVQLLKDLFTPGREIHARVLEGIPEGLELHAVKFDNVQGLIEFFFDDGKPVLSGKTVVHQALPCSRWSDNGAKIVRSIADALGLKVEIKKWGGN